MSVDEGNLPYNITFIVMGVECTYLKVAVMV